MKTSINSPLLVSAIAAALALGGLAPAFAEDAMPKQDRSVGQTVDDATVTASIKTALMSDGRTDALDINVDTMNGKVTLRGGADSAAAKLAATELARNVDGVMSVDNQLMVAEKGSYARDSANTATASGKAREAMSGSGEEINDAWITSKVKTQLLADSQTPGTDISVETKDHVVHLSGVVATAQARAEAIRIAGATEGVTSVQADDLLVRGS